MKFKVERTSVFLSEEKPIQDERLFKETYNYIEVRTLGTFEEFDKRFGADEGKWLSQGINHKINDRGYIEREIPNGNNGWFIEINTLEELLDFKDRCKDEIIIKNDYGNKSIRAIEIYDDYRE